MKQFQKQSIMITIAVLLMFAGFLNQCFGQSNVLTTPGSFSIGVNYWASHAGTHTWRDWRPDVIEADFKQLSENGIKVLRVFPLWPDFQPIHQIYAGEGEKKYIGFKDGPLPQTPEGLNGMSEEQLQHFKTMADLASKYKLKLVVGLITGWMSGQLYVPPALEGKNILTDPESLYWQQKFVSTFVGRFKNHQAILAWDFGNECNVMEKVKNFQQAYVWSALLSGTIKSIDPSRPLVSGMHSLSAANNAPWRIIDQAATTDVLTTHPYSLWTPYASYDGINTMRTILHGAAETRMYGDIGGKPALLEETGVMGPMTGGENEKSAFARTALFTNWAYDCRGTFWWCAYDQLKLNYPPYDYASVEAELGLIKEDRTTKPVIKEFKKFSEFLGKLPFETLPQRKTEAVCILTEGQDSWPVAYASFILAKQAGFDFTYQKAGQELKDAPLYLLPSIKGIDPVFKDYWSKLLEKVNKGATLYISIDDAYLPTINDPLGINILTNVSRRGKLNFNSTNLLSSSLNFSTSADRKYTIDSKQAKVFAKEEDGNPVFLMSTYGKGKIFLLTFPLEMNVAEEVGSLDANAPSYRELYKIIAEPLISQRVINQNNAQIGVTEHDLSKNEKLIIAINYNPEAVSTEMTIKKGWELSNTLYGLKPENATLKINGNDAVVWVVKSKNP
ncbi:glycoside hydrolase family 2 TIM barrel-domain containing protein [Pedobacter lithocola]